MVAGLQVSDDTCDTFEGYSRLMRARTHGRGTGKKTDICHLLLSRSAGGHVVLGLQGDDTLCGGCVISAFLGVLNRPVNARSRIAS